MKSAFSDDAASSLRALIPEFPANRKRGRMQTPPNEITQLLRKWSEGDRAALDQLMPVVYQELRKLAGGYLRGERPDHTLQPTALINEAYIRLVDQKDISWTGRAHFFAVSAQVMRHVLIDHEHARPWERLARLDGEPERSLRLEDPPELRPFARIVDLARTESDRQALRLILARQAHGRPYFLPPGVPAARAAALRRAFDATMRDPAFISEAQAMKVDVDPMSFL